MSICSLIVQVDPNLLNFTAESCTSIEGVEVHATDKRGKLVVSVDHPSRQYCSEVMLNISRIEGVMSSSLVFEYQEDLISQQTQRHSTSQQDLTSGANAK